VEVEVAVGVAGVAGVVVAAAAEVGMKEEVGVREAEDRKRLCRRPRA
jgi:hypothetical protein